MMIKLYQFSPCWNLPNASPFCMKLETYLRMAKIPHEVIEANDPRKSPKKKLPYITLNGEVIADTDIIISRLKKEFDNPDAHLTEEQLSIALAFQRLCDEHLYWVGLYSRWIDEKGWAVLKPLFFGQMKGIKAMIVPGLFRRHMKKELFFQGLGRHTQDELYNMGIEDLKAIAIQLRGKQFFFGDKATSIDANIFSYIANLWHSPYPTPMKEYLKENPALVDYSNRMMQLYFPELVK